MSRVVVGAGRAGLCVAWRMRPAPGAVICRSPARRAAIAARDAGLRVHAAPTPALRDAAVVVFATADRDLTAAAQQWIDSGAVAPGQVWLHLSGVAPPSALDVPGAPEDLGSCHPLAVIPDPLKLPGAPLEGAFFAIDGTERARHVAHALALELGGRPHAVPTAGRPAYHAAASVVANDLVGLVAIGERLAHDAGVPAEAARAGLLHLARTALDAIERAGPNLADGLTGAVGRGDAGTLTAHLLALVGRPADREVHRRLSLLLLEIVADRLSAERRAAVEEALRGGG